MQLASDGEDFHMNSSIVLQPPIEEAEAVTDEDSDHDDTGDVNHLPRRVPTAYKHCSDSLGVIHKRCPQERGKGVKQKRTPADMGGGDQAKLDVHIWLKFDKYLISNLS